MTWLFCGAALAQSADIRDVVTDKQGQPLPVRFKYPATAQTYNKDNYTKAVASMGSDDINTSVWCEKEEELV